MSVSAPLKNLKSLRDDMRNNGWAIEVFSFAYKGVNYFVSVELYQSNETKPKYALCKLKFMDKANLDRELFSPANTQKILINAKELREYFGIEYAENLGDILQQFSEQLGKFIPTIVREDKSEGDKEAMIRCLSKGDSENPNRIYCYKVRHNPKRKDRSPGQRSPFNDNKARILRPKLYEVFKSDSSISFCFSDDPAKERNDASILQCYTDGEMEAR